MACAAACLVITALPCVSAQVAFTDAPAPDYLTYCLESASGKVMPGACAYASYAQLQGYLVTALTNPYGEDNATTLAGINGICSAGCDGELLTLAQSYMQILPPTPPSQSSWCDLVAAPNAVPLLQNSVPFLCLQNEQNQYCAVEVGKALFDANLLPQLVAILQAGPDEQHLPPQLNLGAVNQQALCHSLLTTGCCAQTFMDMAQALLLMTCHPKAAQALSALVAGCNNPLPPSCPGMQFQPFTMPTSCPEGGLVLPPVGTKCPIPAGSCPVTSCEMLCAIVASDPPGQTASPPGIASDVSSDLGNSGGATPAAATASDDDSTTAHTRRAAAAASPNAVAAGASMQRKGTAVSPVKVVAEVTCAMLLFTVLALAVQATTRKAAHRAAGVDAEAGGAGEGLKGQQQLLWPPPQPMHI